MKFPMLDAAPAPYVTLNFDVVGGIQKAMVAVEALFSGHIG
jgi:hypothetical protein